MPITEDRLMHRLYLLAALLFVFAFLIGMRLVTIQTEQGKHYKQLAKKQTLKNFDIEPNRGNLYTSDGSLLATSVTRYDIRFDAATVSNKNYERYFDALTDSLAVLFSKPTTYYRDVLRNARHKKSRYVLIARSISYEKYNRIKNLPLFNLGPYRGGFIAEQHTVRELPLDGIASRSIGHEKEAQKGVGLEAAYGKHLKGIRGKRIKQKVARGLWKPVAAANQVEPRDGIDVVTTLNTNLQDIVHYQLLAQLEKYRADHGCAVLMETENGKIRAIANLGRTDMGKYYEKLNYAVWESHEPGSTFKLMSLIAALEEGVADTTDIVDRKSVV